MDPLKENTDASQSDAAIVKRVQEGDVNAYNLLVIRYQHKVHKIAAKFVGDSADAVDISQEAFIKAYRAIGSFRGESSFYTWLYRIVVNAAKSYLEANQKHVSDVDVDRDDFEYRDTHGALTYGDAPDKIMESEELKGVIFRAINELPQDQKQALVLREVEGMSYEDIALVMKIPVGTVRSRIFRARQYVEEQMAKMAR